MDLTISIFWIWILLLINTEKVFTQTKKPSRIISSRSFGRNTKSSSVTGVDFDCPEEFGYYPHPTDCTQYYVCVFGGALLESCTGGLMYSHELQTCDWPRNVGCEVAEINTFSSTSSEKDVNLNVPQIKQQQKAQVPQRIRFSSVTSSPLQQHQLQTSLPKQQHNQHKAIQEQIHNIPPPPALRVAPNPIITSRGQPKPLNVDSREEIAKLYAEAHDTLPPVEEEETDRQQRVYRGQPSTVSQVQRDRDGILHQINVNALPSQGKIGSYAFGSQVNQFRKLKDFTGIKRTKRETDDTNINDKTFMYSKNTESNNEHYSKVLLKNNATTWNEHKSKDEYTRMPRQIRIYLDGRSPLNFPKSNPYSEYRTHTNRFQPNFGIRDLSILLSSSVENPNGNGYYINGRGISKNNLQNSFPIYRYPDFSPYSSLKPPTSKFEQDFQPAYSIWPTQQTPPNIPRAFDEVKSSKSFRHGYSDSLSDNFSYFHIGNNPDYPIFHTLSNNNSNRNLASSAVGGFLNNFQKEPINTLHFHSTSTSRPSLIKTNKMTGNHNLYVEKPILNSFSFIKENNYNESTVENVNGKPFYVPDTEQNTLYLVGLKDKTDKNQMKSSNHALSSLSEEFIPIFYHDGRKLSDIQFDSANIKVLQNNNTENNEILKNSSHRTSSELRMVKNNENFDNVTNSNFLPNKAQIYVKSSGSSKTSVAELAKMKHKNLSDKEYSNDSDYKHERNIYVPNTKTKNSESSIIPFTSEYDNYSLFSTTNKNQKLLFPSQYNTNVETVSIITNSPEKNLNIVSRNRNTTLPFKNLVTLLTTEKTSTATYTLKTPAQFSSESRNLTSIYNKVTPKNGRIRLKQQQQESDEKVTSRIETSSQSPSNIFNQQRQLKTTAEQNLNKNINNTNQQLYRSSPYDTYYSVYDDEMELYRDVELSNKQRQKSKPALFKPDIVATQTPQVSGRDTFVSKPQLQSQYDDPSLIYGNDYDVAIISQVESDNEYNQPTRTPPRYFRGEKNKVYSIMDQPLMVSRTTNENLYTSTSTLLPNSYAQIPQSTPPSSKTQVSPNKQQQLITQKQPQTSKYNNARLTEQYNALSTSLPDYPLKQTTLSRSSLLYNEDDNNSKDSNSVSNSSDIIHLSNTHSSTFSTGTTLQVPIKTENNSKDELMVIKSTQNTVPNSSDSSDSVEIKDKNKIKDNQKAYIFSSIVANTQPQSFQLIQKNVTERPLIKTHFSNQSTAEIGMSLPKAIISPKINMKTENKATTAFITPTTYSPQKLWRLAVTKPSPFTVNVGNELRQSSSVTNKKNESTKDRFVETGGDYNFLRDKSEKTQSFTTRALIFKDNLSKNFDNITHSKFVSPYKSLETILQDDDQSALKQSHTTVPSVVTSTTKPFRSYFLITGPSKSNVTTLPTPKAFVVNNSFVSSEVVPTSPNEIYKVINTTPAISQALRTSDTTTQTAISSTAIPIRTEEIKPTVSSTSRIPYKKESNDHEIVFRGKLKYTSAYTENLDEPTTYSPKIKFSPLIYNSVSTTPEPIHQRKFVRIRPTVMMLSKTTLTKHSTQLTLTAGLNALKVNKSEQSFTGKEKLHRFSDQNESSEKFADLSKIGIKESSSPAVKEKEIITEQPSYLEKSHILNDSYNQPPNYLHSEEITHKINKSTEHVSTLTYDSATEFQYTTEYPSSSVSSTTELLRSDVSTDVSKSKNRTFNTDTTTENAVPTTITSEKGVVKPTVSYSKHLIPSRVSRINTAIKTSIGRTKLAATTLSKCADNTPNTKCNEISLRTNNRNRGGAHYTSSDQETPSTFPVNRGTHPPRIRPTLKPSGTIVAKASEFIDIYRNPPLRPESLYPQPMPDKTAAKCRKDVCLLPDCYCGGKEIPGDLPVESVPQIVLLTFDDSVNDLNKQLYIDLFEKGRVNPNGCPITATFYVSHEWTDYSQVQNLYADGHEMASHTVSHSFGEQFSQKKWTREVAGQREILAAYGGVKLSDIRGMRAPFLSIGGNKMFKMLYDSNFTYDSSMPVYENRPPSWPYTLDYKIFHDCMIPPCPTKSYPGVWEVPMVMWQDLNGGRCSMGDACSNPADADGVFKMIMKNFERHYTTNRAPFGLFYHAAWFTQPHHKEGFITFLDAINAMNDVWIVTNWQALQWIRDPTPLSRINQFQPFQCDYSDRPKRCNNPKVCNLWHKSGVRYMRTCQPCPDIYPWTGKTGIRSSRLDNDIEE